ncbi:unnamed protein product [Caenorhabditis bovis]|uniref:Uncharacterized protein n=1 Tax=Caenorhabditis bovis TaxID=2654633 RepID=A0A8S1F4M7_9PELO|nr:unnamed protein product [Caenorhabditis bovis]
MAPRKAKEAAVIALASGGQKIEKIKEKQTNQRKGKQSENESKDKQKKTMTMKGEKRKKAAPDDDEMPKKRKYKKKNDSIDIPIEKIEEFGIEENNNGLTPVIFSEDDEAENMSRIIETTPIGLECDDYEELEKLWHAIVKGMKVETTTKYYNVLRKLIMGRVSILQNITELVPNFPADMISVHQEFCNALSKKSGVFPYQYHKGTELISKHYVGGVSEFGALGILCCLYHGVMPFDMDESRFAITRISSIVRDSIKDSLEKAVQSSKRDNNNETIIRISDVEPPTFKLS